MSNVVKAFFDTNKLDFIATFSLADLISSDELVTEREAIIFLMTQKKILNNWTFLCAAYQAYHCCIEEQPKQIEALLNKYIQKEADNVITISPEMQKSLLDNKADKIVFDPILEKVLKEILKVSYPDLKQAVAVALIENKRKEGAKKELTRTASESNFFSRKESLPGPATPANVSNLQIVTQPSSSPNYKKYSPKFAFMTINLESIKTMRDDQLDFDLDLDLPSSTAPDLELSKPPQST